MFRRPDQLVLGLALSALVVACGESSAQAPPAVTVETTPWETPHPATSETPPPPSADSWSITASPGHGPVGTRVHLEGDGFTDGSFDNAELVDGYGVFLLTHFGS